MSSGITHRIFIRKLGETEYRNKDDLTADERANIYDRMNHTAVTAAGYEQIDKTA